MFQRWNALSQSCSRLVSSSTAIASEANDLNTPWKPCDKFSFWSLIMKPMPIVFLILSLCLVSMTWGNQLAGTHSDGRIKFPATKAKLSFTVLHSFLGAGFGDGSNPYAGLVRDAAGNLYGTTETGGSLGFGTVFMVDTGGTETVLYSFNGGAADGASPHGVPVRDAAGNLYGTTASGGRHDKGTVFKVSPTGNETVLHSFSGGSSDGGHPFAGLIEDAAGNFYGTTSSGGTGCDGSGCGVVFKLTKTGTLTVLHTFLGGTADGASPYASLLMDAAGNLYGTTLFGGPSGVGTVFKLSKTGGETLLHSFTGGTTDGASPYAALTQDASANVYGSTYYGGKHNKGIVFRLSPTGAETVLHSFAGGSS